MKTVNRFALAIVLATSLTGCAGSFQYEVLGGRPIVTRTTPVGKAYVIIANLSSAPFCYVQDESGELVARVNHGPPQTVLFDIWDPRRESSRARNQREREREAREVRNYEREVILSATCYNDQDGGDMVGIAVGEFSLRVADHEVWEIDRLNEPRTRRR